MFLSTYTPGTIETRADAIAKSLHPLMDSARVVHMHSPKLNTSQYHDFYDELSEALGRCLQISELSTGEATGEKWMEIRFDPSVQNAYRHAKIAQPLHTDGSYIANAPAVMLIYCVQSAEIGGQTYFVDGVDLINYLQEKHPLLFNALCEVPIHFSKVDQHKTRPIITFDEQGPILTWNYFCVDPEEEPSRKALAERFYAVLESEIAVNSTLTQAVALKPGEAVLWHDERVLHGRRAFFAEKENDRFLWKAGIQLK